MGRPGTPERNEKHLTVRSRFNSRQDLLTRRTLITPVRLFAWRSSSAGVMATVHLAAVGCSRFRTSRSGSTIASLRESDKVLDRRG